MPQLARVGTLMEPPFFGGDVTPPTLSVATASSVGSDRATPGVTTNEDNGTLYFVLVPNGDVPSAAQIKAGQQSSGAAAIGSGNVAVVSIGAKTFTAVTGLTPLTAYDIWYLQRDLAGNDSTAIKYDLTTLAVAPTLSVASIGTPTTDGFTGPSVSTNQGNGTLYWAVVTDGGSCTDTQLKAGAGGNIVAGKASNQSVSGAGAQTTADVTGLVSGTPYQIKFLHRNSSNLDSAQASATGTVTIATGGLKSIVIADATPIDPLSSIGASGNGWAAIVVLKGLTDTTKVADPTKLTLTVSDPGYDTAGAATTVSRTITGVAHMRRQYPNGASKMISTDATDLTLYITLDDWIYAGTTIVSAALASGFYTGSVAGLAGTKTNSSTVAYPKPLFGWMNPQNDSAGATFNVEAVAFHRHATAGQQVAAIKYSVNDGTHTSAEVICSAPTLSSLITNGNVPEVWKGTLDMSAMDQGVICTINAKVYPWLGDSTAVLTLSTDGVAWPTSLPITPLRVLCDRTGGYGGAYAYVNGTGGGTPTVSATPATAKANPYATTDVAATALKAFNNANKGHNDLGGGFIRLMDDGSGGPKTHTQAATIVNSPGLTWLNIEKDPDTAAVVTLTWTGTQHTPTMTRLRNLALVTGTSSFSINGNAEARSMVAINNCTIDNTNNRKIVAQIAMKYLTNITFAGTTTCPFENGEADSNIAIMAGLVGTTSAYPTTLAQPKMLIGSVLVKFQLNQMNTASTDGNDGTICYNNRIMHIRANSTDRQAAIITGTPSPIFTYGWANVQNLVENSVADASTTTIHAFADGDLTQVANYVEFYDTGVGERCSRMYNDTAASHVVPSGIQKSGVSKYCIWDNYNLKADTFTAGLGGVGAWSYDYNVGNVGNISLFGDVQRLANANPHNDNTDTPYLGNAWLVSSTPNLFATALGFSQAQIMAMFTNYTVSPHAGPVAGGNYIPINTATNLKNRVPAGKHVLIYDLAGTVRKTDGTGAAGAYEAAP